MRRWPVAAFVALVIATVAAFFVVQALKVTLPLIAGFPAPDPSVIDPVSGGVCPARDPQGRLVAVSYRSTRVSFYLQHRADYVDVSIVDPHGRVVDTLPGSGVHMQTQRRRVFTWDGRLTDGRVAPDGVYYIRVSLVGQGRSLLISSNTGPEPVTVRTTPPPLRVTGVAPDRFTPPAGVTISYAGNDGRRPRIAIYRLPATGATARPVKTYSATTATGTSAWNGLIAGRPAPPGDYLVGLTLLDRTCNRLAWPATVSAAAAPQAVVTVR